MSPLLATKTQKLSKSVAPGGAHKTASVGHPTGNGAPAVPAAPAHTAAEKEWQAAECLRVGAAERGLLLATATKLAGHAEDGMDLYQQSLLNCHDAIQKKGFVGPNYKFYLLQAIRWLHVERQRAAGKPIEFDDAAHWGPASAPASQADPLASLAADIEQALETSYAPERVLAFRLHADGKTYREIAQVLGPGRDFSWVRRKVVEMKEALRETFGPAWAGLDSDEA